MITMVALVAQVRRHRSSLAETDASDHASAARYRRPEYVGIKTGVLPKLKRSNVEWH